MNTVTPNNCTVPRLLRLAGCTDDPLARRLAVLGCGAPALRRSGDPKMAPILKTLAAALIVLAICYQPAGAGDLYAYVEGAVGHREGMTETWTYEGERIDGTQELNLGSTVGHAAAGLGWRAVYLEAQHVSSLETSRDGGFNALFLGVRHEWRF